MVPEGNVIQNVDRFLGFADDYDQFRPQAPGMVVEIITGYLGTRPSLVVDLGVWHRTLHVYLVRPCSCNCRCGTKRRNAS